jgi:hypothetical protein
MASDTGVWNDMVFAGHTVKISRRKDGYLIGAAGGSSACEAIRQDFLEVEDIEELENNEEEVTVLIAAPDGQTIEIVGGSMSSMLGDFDAIGAAQELAYGAMAAGATAEQAVAIAIEKHAFCAGDIVSITHDGSVSRRTVADVLAEMRA